MHQDCVVLQQEELYISSRKKETCDLRVPRTDVSGIASALEKLNKFERLTNNRRFGEPTVKERSVKISATSSASKLRQSVAAAAAISHALSGPLDAQLRPQFAPLPSKRKHFDVTTQCSDTVRRNYPMVDEQTSLEEQEKLLVIFRKERQATKQKTECKVAAHHRPCIPVDGD